MRRGVPLVAVVHAANGAASKVERKRVHVCEQSTTLFLVLLLKKLPVQVIFLGENLLLFFAETG